MSTFEVASLFITIAALLSFTNYRLMRVPPAIGMTILSLGLATLLLATGKIAGVASAVKTYTIISLVAGLNFNHLVLHGMLAFLLFAGSLQFDAVSLRKQKWTVISLAIFSTAISVILVASLFKLVLPLLGVHIPLGEALLLGALLSPTDPVAALAILRRAGVSESLETKLSGEALFNDAVGAVIFVALLETAGAGHLPTVGSFSLLLLKEAGGGMGLGLILGLIAAGLLRLTSAYRTEILLTLALCMGGYALADALGLSAPLEAVVSGLVLGGPLREKIFSERAHDYVDKFWDLVDSIMNALLFLLLGLELVVVPLRGWYLLAGVVAIPLVLLSRLTSVSAVILPKLGFVKETGSTLTLLTWGGLRGGLSVALALSLPNNADKGLLLTITYVVVVFAIIVQGLTIGRLANRLQPRGKPEPVTEAA